MHICTYGEVRGALTYFLLCEALGEMNTIGVLMPYRTTAEKFTLNAQKLIEIKGGKKRCFDISESVDSFKKISDKMTNLRIGNIMARSRMITLFDIASEERGLVIGTGNKTEILLGYFTLFGDGGCSIEPLGDLYKTEVYEMARLVGVPDEIIEQIPTADLWKGQTDEGELGISYKTADTILYLLIEKNFTEKEIEAYGFKSDEIRRIESRMKNSIFKRRTPLVPCLRKQNRDEFI
jgi:NAD+ synthase